MDDLYDEVMALLHDTGAFADWQQDAAILRRAEQVRRVARSELTGRLLFPARRNLSREGPDAGA
ncbi:MULTISPECIES: hypothetical protein [Mameliella]|uniref:Uncharacterized protein n=1 Tax=Mameliella alba TaxID=561184 RepID=A0A0B3RQ26_9RHOB|nr:MULTISPECIES: hypothetical protein [Mameliella]MBV6634336.1 hypothetical protein [Mameliella sp.]MCR9274695.1 hypothetical protein [Paracoccaceae bacterium]ODM46629.1 hypothetical protein A9320_25710 [Ruegeria sp. PBVC088]KHQ49907.1 hypothetical protein OA50_05530 [Mameliella alba]MBY6121848.1 hypothetical protein [Mameliella alba]